MMRKSSLLVQRGEESYLIYARRLREEERDLDRLLLLRGGHRQHDVHGGRQHDVRRYTQQQQQQLLRTIPSASRGRIIQVCILCH